MSFANREATIKLLTNAGVVWGLIYFAWGAVSSFTLNSIDFWKSVTLLFSMFLLPLPIALLAIWFPRAAGKVLFGSMAITCVAAVLVIASHHEYHLPDVGTFIAHIAAYNIPHLVFGVGYIKAAHRSAGRA